MLRPTHKAIKRYLEDREKLVSLGIANEMGLRAPFQQLLSETSREVKWHFVPEQRIHESRIRPDGVFLTEWKYPLGYWESKDPADDLEKEIIKRRDRNKADIFRNVIFEDSRRAILYQNRVKIEEYNLDKAEEVARLLITFYQHKEENYEDFERAVAQFKQDVPELAKSVAATVHAAYEKDKNYRAAFESFFELCKTSLNPDIRREAVEEMLVQHLLTERLIRTVFDNPEFTRRNVIAAEVEKVISALVAKSFDRQKFLAHLDRFYIAIEAAAKDLHEFSDKQNFLNTVYERFFQGYSVKVADTHGIVYTPQPIVDFMCASVAEVLKNEFGKSLGDKGVNILDPCTGTGNFIVNLMRRIHKRDLPRMYKQQLFANEVMLMPYYIAALNIEHAYYEMMGEYEPFEGICFVDTLDMAEGAQHQLGFMTQKNTERVERQKRTPITVIIGNPPYNANQVNENDNNKNRKYEIIDKHISDTYTRDSRATNLNKLGDPYVKFFKWATERLGKRDGIVCFVSNNSLVDQIAFDGMRKHLMQDFTSIYHLDLHGNVYKNPKLSGTTHNVFGIKVGVGITVAVRFANHKKHILRYYRVPEFWRKEEKYDFLNNVASVHAIEWQTLTPDKNNNWLVAEHGDEYESLVPLGSQEAKRGSVADAGVLFRLFTLGIGTNRDDIVYDFDGRRLVGRVRSFINAYNAEVVRYQNAEPEQRNDLDSFVSYDHVDWSEGLKASLKRIRHLRFDAKKLRSSLYRPFDARILYYDRTLIERVYKWPSVFPDGVTDSNLAICTSGIASGKPFQTLITRILPGRDLLEKTQCFPFYVYNEDGTGRRENVTDWALSEFQQRYPTVCHPEDILMAEGSLLSSEKKAKRGKKTEILPADRQDDKSKELTKRDIFYYVYGLLHHPGYREKFADNLKRELPRIPFAPDFWGFSEAGRKLAELHLKYEEMEVEMPSESPPTSWGDKGGKIKKQLRGKHSPSWTINPDVPLSYHVTKMKLTKDKTQLMVNSSLTLANIPLEVFEYRLGNRSALEWVIDQYQISTDKRSGITSDPNREDDPEYIVRLIGQVIEVSLQTVQIVKALPNWE